MMFPRVFSTFIATRMEKKNNTAYISLTRTVMTNHGDASDFNSKFY